VLGPPIRYGGLAGKAKAIATLELRSELVSVRAGDQDLVFGAVAFADVGRVWAELRPGPVARCAADRRLFQRRPDVLSGALHYPNATTHSSAAFQRLPDS
jgi:hypothetical protein